jgi:uncharacterized DUF497 family protein
MPETFDGFDWDAGNLEKCRKHGVSIAAMENLFAGPIAILPDPQHSVREKRLKAIGLTSEGRARYMHAKEIRAYEKAIAGTEE